MNQPATQADAYARQAILLRNQGRFSESEACYRQALELNPNNAELHNSLGVVLAAQGRFEESVDCFQRALQLKETLIEAHNNLGTSHVRLRGFADAEASFRSALRLQPNNAASLHSLGAVLRYLERYDESETYCRQAVALSPDSAPAHNSLGNVLRDVGRLTEAEACFRRALRLNPRLAEAQNNLSMLLLATGDFEQGWLGFEARWHVADYRMKLPTYVQPFWDGSNLMGRTILLIGDQGLGDTLHFVRYAPLLKERGATVFLHHSPLLTDVLRTCAGIDRLIPIGIEPPPFDVYAPLESLPRLCGTTVATIPTRIPYLDADVSLVNSWRSRFLSSGFKAGVVWQGNPDYFRDRQRSLPLRLLEPVFRVPGVQFYSLQMGPAREQLPGFPVIDLGSQFDPTSLSDAAAAIKNLDLLIAVDTALAHLAGALGAPTWLLLPFVPDWRWLLERSDCPWYPTMRLFRQPQPGTWTEAVARVSQELKCLSTVGLSAS